MGDPSTSSTKKPKLPLVTRKPGGPGGPVTLHTTPDSLQSIFIYTDEGADKGHFGGTISFVGKRGPPSYVGILIKTWFPAGAWKLTLGARGEITAYSPFNAQEVSAATLKTLQDRGKTEDLISWSLRNFPPQVDEMLDNSVGKQVRLVVSYTKAKPGNPKSLIEQLPLTDSNVDVLKDPEVARIYLEFVEHFGRIDNLNYGLSEGGLTREELDQVEQGKPELVAITNLFTQGFAEFQVARGAAAPPSPILLNFRAMEETIFRQRDSKNDLARRNMLMIGVGARVKPTNTMPVEFESDIGVIRRAAFGTGVLLYDRSGLPVRGLNGYQDVEYRSVDISKMKRDSSIPFMSVEVDDVALYRLLRGLEQGLADPLREVEALAVSLFKHTIFIANEVHAQYNGEIKERFLEMLPGVILFFVAHAMVSAVITVAPPLGFALLGLLHAAGALMGLDAALMMSDNITTAGRHFAQMESIHRGPDDKKPVLTSLSYAHLKAGAHALLDGMADFIALGVVIAGTYLGFRLGPALVKGVKAGASKARVQLRVAKGKIVEIKALITQKTLELRLPKPEPKPGGLKEPGKADAASTPHVVEADNATVAEGQKGRTPEITPLEPNRPRALDQKAAEFRQDTAAQLELFEAAKGVRDKQKARAQKVLKKVGINVEPSSLLKRDRLDQFVKEVAYKVEKNDIPVGKMPDIVRGRIDAKEPKDVARIAKALMEEYGSRARHKPPSERSGVEEGYPRHHVIVTEETTGLLFEWQIGMEATTRLYEKPGLNPGKVKIEATKANLHVEYDVFAKLENPGPDVPAQTRAEYQALAQELGIPQFRRRLYELSARTGKEKIPPGELEAKIDQFLREASVILAELVKKKGVQFVDELL